jgi:hypothetical protein
MVRDESVNQAETKPPVETEQQVRWSYRKVGLALFLLIVVAVGGTIVLDRQLKPRTSIEPAPVAQTTPAPAGAPTPPSGGEAPPVVNMPSDPLEREIVEAYLHYWEVRIQAYYSLDASLLPEVMAGAELVRERQQMEDFREQGKAVKVDVEHHLLLVEVAPDRAVVYDEYLNRSVFIDSTTKEEFPTKEPPGTEKISYEMHKIDGRWKVVDGRQHR